MFEEIRSKLYESVDEKYRTFSSALVPGDVAPMLGVRVPELRKIAKMIAKENAVEYMNEISKEKQQRPVYHEELLLYGMTIGYLKCKKETRAEYLDRFVPVIDNWAVCDSSCFTYKFMQKDMEYWFQYLLKYVNSVREYEVRFAVVSMICNFIVEDYIEEVLQIFGEIKQDGYYAKMAVAWAISVCYAKFPEPTWDLLASDKLGDFTHQKSIQKIRESYRVSKEEKARVNTLRRDK